MDQPDFSERLRQLGPTIESAIATYALPARPAVANLDDGVRYALGLDVAQPERRGKRLRPALAILACEQLGGNVAHVLPFAVAVELMHNYFLDRPRNGTTPDDVARAIEMLSACGAMDAARAKIADLAQAARDQAAQMSLRATRFFCDLADYLEKRTK